jgi:cobalamin biosynthesis protein CobD/CbiB
MHHLSNVELALAALLLEATFGYPAFIYRVIGHPVIWMGGSIGRPMQTAGDGCWGR